MTDTFDYIIVGAGSAGCVLADRLSADGRTTVLVLEYGGSDASIFIRMPSALNIPLNNSRFSWGYASEPEPNLDNRIISQPRGKALGGSSAINGMVYVRGNPHDFDRWSEEGASGWSYAEVLPYFKRAETREEGGDLYRGSSGPLHTSYGKGRNPLYRAFVDAGVQAGYPETADINGYQQEGFGRFDMTVRRGRRWSAADAYLRPAMDRENVEVRTHALVTRVAFEGNRAAGVHYLRGERETYVAASREVIIAGGAINSPQLLKLSGIGPADELTAQGIPVIADRRGVGANLQDHLEFYFQVASRKPVTLFSSMGLLARAQIGLRWLIRGDGLGATNHFETGGFIRSRAGIQYPDIQYHFLPLAVSYDGKSLATEHSFQAHVGPMRSRSKGSVTLRSGDVRDKPMLRFNYMSHADDWTEMRACVRLTREIFAQAAFDPYRGREISPGAEATTDEAIDAFVRSRSESAYHPSCTCRMGEVSDPDAVTDSQARVIGVERLRVVDASIMPSITTGNLNAPTIMIGEKAADMILGRPPLAAEQVPVFVARDWQTKQR